MRIYKPGDLRGYPLCLHFIIEFKDVVKLHYDEYNSKIVYFPNYLSAILTIYKTKLYSENDYAIMNYYEGVKNRIYYYLSNLSYYQGFRLSDNRRFNYERMIERCTNELDVILQKSQLSFSTGLFHQGAFYLGQYFGCKEVIKLCKKFKRIIEEDQQ